MTEQEEREKVTVQEEIRNGLENMARHYKFVNMPISPKCFVGDILSFLSGKGVKIEVGVYELAVDSPATIELRRFEPLIEETEEEKQRKRLQEEGIEAFRQMSGRSLRPDSEDEEE